MELRNGRCGNDMFCSLASSGHTVSVPADGNFVCPQCSRPLVAANERARRSPLVLGALAGGALALAGGGLFAAGTFMGSGTAAQMPAARPVPDGTVQVAMNEVSAAPTQTAPAPFTPGPTTAPATTTAAVSPAPDARPNLSVIVTVAQRQLNPLPYTGPAIAQLTATLAPLQVIVPHAADVAHPMPLSAEAQAAARALAEEQRRALLAAREDAARAQRESEQKRIADAREAAERARLALEAARQAKPVASAPTVEKTTAQATAPVPPPHPAGVSRPFTAVAVAGGAPDYPDAYDDANRAGRVTVNCRIERDGSPHNCHVVETRGGRAFATSVLKWLDSGRVRYQPAVRDGAPVAETQQWSVNFRQ